MNKVDVNGLTEREFLAEYKPGDYDRPSVTVDMMVLRMKEDLSCMQVLLIKRKAHPEIDKWALPGGFINIKESAYEAACRELKEETGLTDIYLEQLYTMSQPDRDPRMRIIDIAYIALLPYGYERSEKFKNGVITVENFVPVSVSDEKLAFDHDQIILEGLMRIRNKAEYTGIMFNLVPREFTIPDLLKVFEVLSGKEVHPKVFREKIAGQLVSLDRSQRPIVGRKPAAVYRYVDLNMDERKLVKVHKKYKNGVILTRAQPFHNGHLNMIKQAASECENLLVVIGSANKSYTKRNPFPIEYRKRLVENVLQEEDLSGADVKVMTLSDWSMEDAAQYVKEWGSFFYYNIANEIGEKSFTFYYNDDPKIAENWFTDDILKNVTIRNLGRSDIEISSTMIRDLLYKKDYDKVRDLVPRWMWKDLKQLGKILMDATNDDYMM